MLAKTYVKKWGIWFLLILFYMKLKIVFLLHGIDFQNFLFIVLITFKGVFAELDIVQFAL